jgi:glycine cleavage system H protein
MMKFSQTHEWVQAEGAIATVGISDAAQKEIGEIVYVELPVVGRTLQAGEEAVVLESTKAAVDIYSPVSGKITAVNEQLRTNPEKINQAAESEGWLFKLHLHNPEELSLLTQK